MQSEQISAYSEANGFAHILHDGPEYFSIPAQQPLQKGAIKSLSEGRSHIGQADGKMEFTILEINPDRREDGRTSRICG